MRDFSASVDLDGVSPFAMQAHPTDIVDRLTVKVDDEGLVQIQVVLRAEEKGEQNHLVLILLPQHLVPLVVQMLLTAAERAAAT